ncbi:MAG TPA: transporter substrate-binding domain-containing protein [Oscillospiraceae bacterium]|nr:transporter substrate-binding domain-containing protein [Oscillospiraceae bacterium]
MKKFSKIVTVISLFLVMALLFTACGKKVSTDTEGDVGQPPADTDIDQPPADDESPRIKEIKQAGKLVLGTSADYPPYEFHSEIDGKDTIVGFDIEIAREMAKDLDVELEIKDMDFDGLLLALNAGKVDIVLAGMTPKPERDAEFSKIYYKALQGILVHKDNKDVYKTIDDLTGKRIGAQKGAIQEDLAKEEIKDLRLKALNKIPDLVLEVKHKKIDAVLMEMPVAEAYAANNDDLHLMPIELIDEEGGSAVAAKTGDKELIDFANKTLDRLENEGSIEKFVIEAVEMVE